MAGRTLLEKIWDSHIAADRESNAPLLHIDRHIVHESVSAHPFAGLAERGLNLRNPELTFATIDHIIATTPGRTGRDGLREAGLIDLLRSNCAKHGVALFDLGSGQGIVHVVAPEQGLALPGMTLVCADSHTATCGALGVLAWGIGSSEAEHVFATQMLRQRKPKSMRVRFEGTLRAGVSAKDLVLYLIGAQGVAAGAGYAVEYGGAVVRALSIEGRMTLCNMSIEWGAKFGFVAPDQRTFDYLRDKPYAPRDAEWDQAVAFWRTLPSDDNARFDHEVVIDCSQIAPQITWGTNPGEVIGVDQRIPDPASIADRARREAAERSLSYQGLVAGQAMKGVPIDVAFIGSCTNSRLSDLRAAAAVIKGRQVANGVRALVVPGSTRVREMAEREGLDRIFKDAGFEWREAGCSMCLAANGDVVPANSRCISTSNRNFENRQGRGARTHLAAPATVAAAAIAGRVTDVI